MLHKGKSDTGTETNVPTTIPYGKGSYGAINATEARAAVWNGVPTWVGRGTG